jgi:NAD-dependent DNA ligase
MKDANITKERKLKFFAYDLANFQDFSEEIGEKKYYNVIKKLESFDFEISPYFKAFSGIDEIINVIENF